MRNRFLAYLLAAASVGVVVVTLLDVVHTTDPNTASPLLLLAVLASARLWGVGPALFAAMLAAGSYSYYFLPPEGFAIRDPEDWLAFFTFVGTAVITGELAARAERRRQEALAGRIEIERLYGELQGAFDRASEAEAARRNEQLKAALLDALTHNLRTPLTAIKASVTALLGAEVWQGVPRIAAEGERELLQVIDEESDRLNRFIEGLSNAGSAEELPQTMRRVDLEPMLRSAIARAETVTRNHRVVLAADEDLPQVAVDAASAIEAIYIALDNASKYAPPGSQIRVGARYEDDRHVRVVVEDEGPGIPPELRERVFEKFYRIPGREPRDARRRGVGLGLSIARRLIEAQGGRMWIDNTPSGRGTAIAMTLPIGVGEPAAENALAGAAATE